MDLENTQIFMSDLICNEWVLFLYLFIMFFSLFIDDFSIFGLPLVERCSI